MISKNGLKYYQSLLQKKVRRDENKFFVEGIRIVEEGLKSDFKCEIIFLSTSFEENNKEYLNNLVNSNFRIDILKEKEFEKLSETKHSQGIAAVFQKKKADEIYIGRSQIIVALENISDPGNAGTIIRNCDWFGIKEIIWGENCVELYNPKVLRASMGSIFHSEICESLNLLSNLKELCKQGYSITCSDLDGINVFQYQLNEKAILIFSSEARGPSKEILKIANQKINIPRIGNAESLNVAIASAVVLAELTKNK